jgi:uncharacterized protein
MLLEFTVENYRSIKEPVTLSAVAQKAPKRKSSAKSKRGVKSDAEICPGFEVEGWDLTLLPVMAIFGANASGKSNVIKALEHLLSIVTSQGIRLQIQNPTDQNSIIHEPFKLDSISRDNPTIFTLQVAISSSIYKYRLALNRKQVTSESLEYSNSLTKRPRVIFSREWDLGSYKWKKGEGLTSAQFELGKTIRENEIFITILNRFRSDLTSPFYQWAIASSIGLYLNFRGEDKFSSNLIANDSESAKPNDYKDQIVEFLRRFDTGIFDIETHKDIDSGHVTVYAIHQTEQGNSIRWNFEEESLGTQTIFSLAGLIVIALKVGGVVLLDELGTNLHPKITSYIIQLFQNSKTNPKGAQLVFTSHDNTLQRNQLLRRDQIWFTEKRSDQSTDLYSLADFKVRNDLAIDKAYLDGRFGAVPFLPETVEELLGVD